MKLKVRKLWIVSTSFILKSYNFFVFRTVQCIFASEKESLIESQQNNLTLLEKLKSDYERKDSEISGIQKECHSTIENLRYEMKELSFKDKEKSFEIEQLKNSLHQYTNREGNYRTMKYNWKSFFVTYKILKVY